MVRPTERSLRWRWQNLIDSKDRQYLDGDQSCYFNRLMDLGEPTEDKDAVTKEYVDYLFFGAHADLLVILQAVADRLGALTTPAAGSANASLVTMQADIALIKADIAAIRVILES